MECMWGGKHVIYVMKCRGRGEEYICETETFLRKRVTVHSWPENKNVKSKWQLR